MKVNIKSKIIYYQLKITGTNFSRLLSNENIGSAQVKSCIILSALNTPGITTINSKSSGITLN